MDVVMPQLGETVAEGTVMVWHKKVGDKVAADEVLFEVGTDKVETEIPAPTSGTLTEILVAEGETVDVGVRLAVIDDGSVAAAKEPEAKQTKAAAAKKTRPERAKPERAKRGKRDGERLSPVVKRLLEEHGLAAADITGTGRDGRITRDDVLAATAGSPAGIPGAARGGKKEPRGAKEGGTVIPFNNRRKMIAEHMVRSAATSAHVLQAVEADFSKVVAARSAAAGDWKKAEGFSLTYLPFVARAVCLAIADYPNVNASVDGDNLVVHQAINLSIAVDLNFDGLVVPVIHDADKKSLPDLARAINDLATRARAEKLGADDYAGGTYTISNSGTFGTMITAPIINQPQIAILSTDGIAKKPAVIEGDGEDRIEIRPIGVLAQSFDHRGIDGAYSAAFLKRLREIVETADWASELG